MALISSNITILLLNIILSLLVRVRQRRSLLLGKLKFGLTRSSWYGERENSTRMDGMKNTSGNRLAVVTGASMGIGLELARQFAMNGYHLLIAAQSDEILAARAE